jgi:hypothetical protein
MEPVSIGRVSTSGTSRISYWRDIEECDTPPRWLRTRQLRDFLSTIDESAAAFAYEAVGREGGR